MVQPRRRDLTLPLAMRQFPPMLNKLLMRERKSLHYLMREMKSAKGHITSHVYQLAYGEKLPSPERTDMIADVLKLNGEDRIALHRAAALDHGWKIGAPPR